MNPVDLTTRAGVNISETDVWFPMVVGWDVAGTVREVGPSVTSLAVGDRVAAMVFQPIDQSGTYAAQVVPDSGLLAPVPEDLTLQQAATLPLVGLTASQLVDHIRTDGARSLLSTGPLGGVGRQVVALAARAGLEVLGAAAVDRAPALLTLGATAAVGRDGFAAAVRSRYPNGVDAAIDLVGGAASHAAFDQVRDGGRYVTSVPPYVDPSGRFETARGVDLHVHTVAPDQAQLTELLFARGTGCAAHRYRGHLRLGRGGRGASPPGGGRPEWQGRATPMTGDGGAAVSRRSLIRRGASAASAVVLTACSVPDRRVVVEFESGAFAWAPSGCKAEVTHTSRRPERLETTSHASSPRRE